MPDQKFDVLADALTASLQATSKSAAKQLDQLKKELSTVLQMQPLKEVFPSGLTSFEQFAFQPAVEKFTTVAASSPGGKIESTLKKVSGPATFKVVRREVPVITSQFIGSTPAWAAGMAIDHTLGPFQDGQGKVIWWDFYKIIQNIIVQRGTDQVLMIPIRGLLTSQQQYHLTAGSVWIRSALITSLSPGGAYTGLKIKSGTITFGAPVSISGGNIIIAGGADSFDLVLDLDQPNDNPATGTSTGEDARKLIIHLPQKLKLGFNASSAIIEEAGDMDQNVYGNPFSMTYKKSIPNYNVQLNRILIPFSSNPANPKIDINKSLSKLFHVSGQSAVKNAYWALPVTVSPINQLGQAAGIGAIALEIQPGIVAQWDGLEKGPAELEDCYLMTEPGRISWTASAATSKRSREFFELWNETNPERKIRSRVDLWYQKPFLLLFNSLSSGSETLILVGASMQASIDRPISADGARLKIEVPFASCILFENKGDRVVYVLALNIMQQLLQAQMINTIDPIAFALKNAFFKTTPVDDFFLLGKWNAPNSVESGTVAFDCPMYFIMPTLPDPYVSNYYLNIARQERSYYSSSGNRMSLVVLNIWKDIDDVNTIMGFIADTTDPEILYLIDQPERKINPAASTGLYTAAPEKIAPAALGTRSLMMSFALKENKVEQVQKEDQTNTQNLRTLFNRELNTGLESFFLLDVSTNADLFGVGVGLSKERQAHIANNPFPFYVKDLELITYSFNTRIYTLPQIQWEPIQTIQNPDVKPYPFPSPATSPDTGDPTIIGTESIELVPVAPIPVIAKFIDEYNKPGDPQKLSALISLPFGMKSMLTVDNPNDASKQGAQVSLNAPVFDKEKVDGGMQITILATSPDSGPNAESPEFKGATIQTRNLIDLITGTIPLDDDGRPLSVLGPVVDIIFNGEFRPGGNLPRVPLSRLDISGYGASIFSNWLNPNAAIAATSQAKFDVIVGRTSHEIIQVKSILYPWGIAVVRTITIQRTSGGGVTRYDSGWKAQGAGLYDFSFYKVDPVTKVKSFVPNPYEFHPGVVKGMYNVTEIKDTGRIYHKLENIADPNDDVIMQEVFFNSDVLIEDVQSGASNGYVPSKGQRGFVQLSPYQKTLTPLQFYTLLSEEGSLGGPVDCVINVGLSGQPMRIIRVDVNGVSDSGANLFPAAARGSIPLPKEGSWSLVKSESGSGAINSIDEDGGLPLIREGKLNGSIKKPGSKFHIVKTTGPAKPYRFADPVDIKEENSPASDYGLLHSTGSQKVLFLRPTIARNDPNIKSTLTPFFADSYALLGSVSIFPNVNSTFPLGGGGTVLQIIGAGKLKLNSGGNYTVPGGFTRDLLTKGDSRIYVDYSDVADGSGPTQVNYSFDSTAVVPWTANLSKLSIVTDLFAFKGLTTLTTGFDAAHSKKPQMNQPKMKFGSILQPIIDLVNFLGNFNMAQALGVDTGNATVDSWQFKLQAVLVLEIEFKTPSEIEIKVAHDTVLKVGAAAPEPQVILGLEISLKEYFNFAPFSLTSNDPSTDLSAVSKDMTSTGASLEIEGTAHILIEAPIYAVGILAFEFGIDDKEGKSFTFKIAVGAEIRAEWDVIGEVSVLLAIGLEMEFKDTGTGVFALMIFKGEAELLDGLIAISISIEAKGGEETSGPDTFAVCEVEFALDISLAFVIHFEIDLTWEEKRQIS